MHIYMCVYVYTYIYIYIYTYIHKLYIISAWLRGEHALPADVGGSKNTARAYCLDIPRFEESLDNQQQQQQHETAFEEQGI